MSISYAVFCLIAPPPCSTLFPYTTLFRSFGAMQAEWSWSRIRVRAMRPRWVASTRALTRVVVCNVAITRVVRPTSTTSPVLMPIISSGSVRSEEHTSELQSHVNLVCRLLLDRATSVFYTLSLHDALPIFRRDAGRVELVEDPGQGDAAALGGVDPGADPRRRVQRGDHQGGEADQHDEPGADADHQLRQRQIGRAHV